MKFCDKLVKQRKNNNMSQEQLADRLGVSRQAVSKWESGNSMPDMAKILELCKILNCNLEDLVDDGVSSTKDIMNSKVDINNYIKEFLNFVTNTINMFWSMTLGEKVKCIVEMLIILIILFTVWGIIGRIINLIFFNILSMLPSTIYRFVRGICSVIYGLFGFITGVIIIIHIFKIRYLDYFITIEDNNTTNKTIEISIDNDNKNVNDNKIKFINNKKNKIIIRDPKHSTYSFFEFLGKILICIIKFILILVAFPCICSFIGVTFGITFSIWYIKYGIFFLGIVIILLGLLLINYLVLRFIYNFVLNQKIRFNILFIIFIAGLLLTGIGSGISFCDYMSFDKKVITSKDIKYINKSFNLEMKDNLILEFLEHYNVEFIEDNNLNNIKIELTQRKDIEVDLYNYMDSYYDMNNGMTYLIYDFNYHADSGNAIDEINYLLKQLKSKERIYNDYVNVTKIKIYASKDNIQKLKDNYNYFYK